MSRTLPRSLLIGIAVVVAATAAAPRAETFQFADVVGWWSAEPSSPASLRASCCISSKRTASRPLRLSLLGIGGYEVPIGTVTIDGMTLDMKPYPFPLHFDPQHGTLRGQLPEAAVPVYKIPVEFRRIEPLAKPEPRTWEFPRPRVRWTFDTGAAVWAGIERDAASGLIFVANDAGTLHALDAKGAERWKFATGKPIKARPAVIGDSRLRRVRQRLSLQARQAQRRGALAREDRSRQPGAHSDEQGRIALGSLRLQRRRRRQARLRRQPRQERCTHSIVATGKEQWRVQTQDMMTATPALYRDLGAVRRLQRHGAGGRRERRQGALDLRRETAGGGRSGRRCATACSSAAAPTT